MIGASDARSARRSRATPIAERQGRTRGNPLARKQIDPDRRLEIGRERRTRTRARIVAAAFDVFGDADGLYARIEDVADRAEVTRATFYNHFTGMAELRDALTVEVTHDFLLAVTNTISQMPDARDRSACAVRFYLHRARTDRRWAWSMINLSAGGLIFGAETFRQAEQTVHEGVQDNVFPLQSVELGRDLLLGTTLAAMPRHHHRFTLVRSMTRLLA